MGHHYMTTCLSHKMDHHGMTTCLSHEMYLHDMTSRLSHKMYHHDVTTYNGPSWHDIKIYSSMFDRCKESKKFDSLMRNRVISAKLFLSDNNYLLRSMFVVFPVSNIYDTLYEYFGWDAFCLKSNHLNILSNMFVTQNVPFWHDNMCLCLSHKMNHHDIVRDNMFVT